CVDDFARRLVSFGAGVSWLAARGPATLRRSPLHLARLPHPRQRKMVRLRPLLRAYIRISDASLLLYVGAVCVAEPVAQRRPGVRIQPGVAPRRAVRPGRGDLDA